MRVLSLTLSLGDVTPSLSVRVGDLGAGLLGEGDKVVVLVVEVLEPPHRHARRNLLNVHFESRLVNIRRVQVLRTVGIFECIAVVLE